MKGNGNKNEKNNLYVFDIGYDYSWYGILSK